MTYVAIKRLRALLTAYAAGCAVLAAAAIVVVHSHGMFTVRLQSDSRGVRLTDLLVLGTIMAYTVSSFGGTHLAAERRTLPFLWTRPQARVTSALRIVAVDVVAIALAILIGVLAQWLVLATVGLGAQVRFDALAAVTLALALGSAVAWYALVMLVSAVQRDGDNASVAAVMSWPVFAGIVFLATIALAPDWRWATALVAHLDPLAYLLGSFSDAGAGLRAVEVWILAVVAGTLAITGWIRTDV